ncbi:MAG: polysaccharide biosynthesis/export family protein [Pseudomonadota bacterium]
MSAQELDSVKDVQENIVSEKNAPSTFEISKYLLGPQDELNIIIYGENNLSGTYSIDEVGYISIPLINELKLSNLNLRQAEKYITEKLADGYLVEPSVSIEVVTYRPFYILGEVRKPGSYAYISGMNTQKAAALAGGFTYRANRKNIEIMRASEEGNNKYKKFPIDTEIFPGDIIMVKERFF